MVSKLTVGVTVARHSAEYEAVMRSERWRALCRKRGRELGWRCERCGYRGRLEGHHWRGYSSLGKETPWDVEMLCGRCHAWRHGRVYWPDRLRLIVWLCVGAVLAWIIWNRP